MFHLILSCLRKFLCGIPEWQALGCRLGLFITPLVRFPTCGSHNTFYPLSISLTKHSLLFWQMILKTAAASERVNISEEEKQTSKSHLIKTVEKLTGTVIAWSIKSSKTKGDASQFVNGCLNGLWWTVM